MTRAIRVSLLPVGVALGVLAESTVLYRRPLEAPVTAHAVHLAAADFVVGVVLVSSGVVAWHRRDSSRIGKLLVAAGFTWFLGTFADSTIDSVAGLGAAFVTLHRGPLVHAVISYPKGSLKGSFDRAVVLLGYLAAAIPRIGDRRDVTFVLAGIVVVAAWRARVMVSAAQRPARMTALAASVALAAALVAGPTLGQAGLWVYETAIAAIAVGLVLDLLRAGWTDAAVTGLVVELGDAQQRGNLRDRLAAAVGDPSLEIGYWLRERGAYFDAAGTRIELPVGDSAREVTLIREGEEPVAALVHDASLADDRGFLESVAAASRLAVTNVRLQAEIRRQVGDVAASRRRLLEAGDQERRQLERELRDGPERRLARVEGALSQLAQHADEQELLAEALAELERARRELREFARGVHPHLLTDAGLSAALADLARGAGVPVEVRTSDGRASAAVEAAAYFVCSEALANAAKHAGASTVAIDVDRRDSKLIVAIRDDGCGGARFDGGSGLGGLADRVEAVGGRFSIDSPRGRGTLVVAELPLA